jgi:hypothetical protein
MFIADLFENYVAEAGPELVVLYPGRFQPFHLGHGEVFRSLQNKFGRDNVYIATSNKVELPSSPFNFSDKSVLMHAAGVPSDRIIEVKDPYKLPPQFNPANTIFIVAVGAPDAERLDVDKVYTEFTPTGRKSKIPPGKKVGDPKPFKSFTKLEDCVTADKHGYVIIANERQKVIKLNGQPVDVSHGTQSRAAWNAVRNEPKLRSEYLLQMYGRDDPELGRILDKIPQPVNEEDADEDDNKTPFPDVDKNIPYPHVEMPGSSPTNSMLHKKINADPYKPPEMGSRESTKIWPDQIWEEAAGVGVIASKKQARDPRYSHSLTSDIRPGEVGRQLKKMHLADSVQKLQEQVASLKEKWSAKYKRSINCNSPRGFSQRAHCQGRKK